MALSARNRYAGPRHAFGNFIRDAHFHFHRHSIRCALSLLIGMSAGLVAGYFEGFIDNLLMRIGDITLSIPTILVAILVSTVVRQMLPADLREMGRLSRVGVCDRPIRMGSICKNSPRPDDCGMRQGLCACGTADQGSCAQDHGQTYSPKYAHARARRRHLEFRHGHFDGSHALLSRYRHAAKPAVHSETLIRIGNQFLFSGSWWIVLFPVLQLCLLVVAVNLIGDWLRDALNRKLR